MLARTVAPGGRAGSIFLTPSARLEAQLPLNYGIGMQLNDQGRGAVVSERQMVENTPRCSIARPNLLHTSNEPTAVLTPQANRKPVFRILENFKRQEKTSC